METITLKREVTKKVESTIKIKVPTFKKRKWGSDEYTEVYAVIIEDEKKVFIDAYMNGEFLNIAKRDAQTLSDYSLTEFQQAEEIEEEEFWKIYRSIKRKLN